MDKWKKSELTKMCVGGNQKAREYLESQSDYRPTWTLREKYTSRAATALREKVLNSDRDIYGLISSFYRSRRKQRERIGAARISLPEATNLTCVTTPV